MNWTGPGSRCEARSPMKLLAALCSLSLAACASSSPRHPHHHAPGYVEAPTHAREATTETRRGGSHQQSITCGQQHRYTLEMGANETLRATVRLTMTGAEPLGEDIAWRWLGPTGSALDTNALPIPEPNGPVREATVENRSTYAGRYTLVIAVEDGAGCAHASYTLELR